MSEKEFKPDAIHLHVETFWKSFHKGNLEGVFKEAILHLGPMQKWALRSSFMANQDGSLNPRYPNEWRGIPINVHFQSAPNRFVGNDVYEPDEIIKEPFCLYLEVIKKNGRRVYFDHPKTDKQFL